MSDCIPVQINRLESDIATIRTNGHSGLMAYANDIQKLVYQEGSTMLEHLFSDDAQINTLISNTSGTIQSGYIGADDTLSGVLTNYINTISGVITSGTVSNMALDDLTDVATAGEAKNLVLKFNGTTWVPAVYNASFTFSIATFTSNAGATTFQIGTGNWKDIGSLSFSATYSNGPSVTGYITHTGWSSLFMDGVGFEGPTLSTEAVTYPAVGSTKAFTLHASDGTDTDTDALTYYFYNYRFWGVDSDTSLDEAGIEALAGSELSNSKAKTFTVTAAAGEYIWYCYPSRLGTVTFTVGGFEGGFEAPATVSVTNALGYVENYYAYRSTNSGLGSTTVVAT